MEEYGLLDFLKECLGYKVENVHLLSRNYFYLYPFTDVAKILDGLHINKLEVEIEELTDNVYVLLNLLCNFCKQLNKHDSL